MGRNDNVAWGLDGIVVAETSLSDVDGETGRLILRGYDVESLAERATFEDAVSLLETGTLPSPTVRERVRAEIAAGRADAWARLAQIGTALDEPDGMEALRASLAHLRSTGDERLDARRVLGACCVFAAAWARRRAGAAPIEPSKDATQASDLLRMIGCGTEPWRVSALDRYLVTVSDHGMNASTFTARVVASTGSDTVSAIVAAVGALKGPLHGGAPGPVLDMLDAIGTPDRATAWLEAELSAGRRIMGMGHRIYRVRDPRAKVFERGLEALERAGVHTGRLSLARAVEHAAEHVLRARHPDRPLHANVEFYTAVLLDAVGLPRSLFSPTFAVGRAAGWTCHIAEQRAIGRLIRPSSRYVGPAPTHQEVTS